MTTNVEAEESNPDVNRRNFLRNLTGMVGVATVTAVPIARKVTQPQTIPLAAVSPRIALAEEVDPNADILTRMQAELIRSLEKPADQRHWVMVIDLRKCIGCHACTVSCVAENKLPPGVAYRPVSTEEVGVYPNTTMRFTPRPCMQCDVPPCTPVCPVNATYKDENGIVVVDYDQCIGCRYCMIACPYNARYFDFGHSYNDNMPEMAGVILGQGLADDYERLPSYEYGEERSRLDRSSSPIGNVRKCHFCLHRLVEGMLPACTTTCVGRATYFGDANDSDSLVAELIASPNVIRLKEELGTQPRVYYLS